MLAITGITGHTGGFFLSELVAGKYQGHVRCMVRSLAGAQHLLNCSLNIELIEGNLDDNGSIKQLLSGVDTVVHIANIHYSSQILQIGKECGVRRFILVHTTGMYSKHKSASQGYIDIENEIKPFMDDLNVTILRPTMIFGDMRDYNISKFIRFVDRLPLLPVVSKGNALIQPINARDLGRALYQTMNTACTCGRAYDLSGERALSIRELYLLIANQLGKKRMIISVPERICVICAVLIRCVTFRKIDLVEKVQRMSENRSYNHQKAVADFGYAPECFEVGLQREINEYLDSRRKNRGKL